jgi:ATP-dependent Lhr-like helicase
MLSDGFTSRHGARAGLLHRDAVNRRLRPRKGARLTALISGGTIPDTADYTVVLEPQAQTVGTVNEDFAVESLAGDVFQLGNASYRIIRVEPGRVRVEDAHGAAPSIPFWLGEAPGRSDELSQGVARLREDVLRKLELGGAAAASAWLADALGLAPAAVAQLVDYLGRAAAAFGTLPTQERIVFERFFDESGGTQLVIHSPFGSRINRAWGLALRKRFCRKFNVELQAAATEDAIVLSLSTGHSFVLGEVAQYLHSSSALDVLVQALLDAPLFAARWRWNATTALALPRFRGGRKVAPQLQRMRAEDLLAGIFPDQVACAENLAGDREVPSHPLVAQTLEDCLHEAMDSCGWLQLLQGLESGRIAACACDLTAPSPLAAEAINARPYAFLDDAPLEERRTQAVQSRRYMEPQSGDDLGRLDVDAIRAVAVEAWPQPRSADEMHEALGSMGAMTEAEAQANPRAGTAQGEDPEQLQAPPWLHWLQELARDGRATRLAVNAGDSAAVAAHDPSRPPLLRLWVTTERLPQLQAGYPAAVAETAVTVPPEYAAEEWTREAAIRELARARLSALGPVTATRLAAPLGLERSDVDAALLALQQEGFVLSGRFTPPASEPGADEEWCERHLLARIHRYTLRRLRREIEPVAARDFMRFLFDWQHLGRDARMSGPDALAAVLAQLEGFEAPAAAWEAELLPSRLTDYSMSWLDDLCTAGRTIWTRLRPPAGAGEGTASAAGPSLKAAPLLLLPRRNLAGWVRLAPAVDPQHGDVSARGRRVLAFLADHGASFFDELADGTHLLRTELEDALGELVSQGRVHCDSFAGVRSLLVPASRRSLPTARRRRGMPISGIQDAGRWALVKRAGPFPADTQAPPAARAAGASAANRAPTPEDAAARSAAVEHAARVLLRRYGVVSWRLLDREAPWLPPWRELVRVFQRLEARGEIRGGRFIAGLSGEQFALPEAIAALRQVRRRPGVQQWTCVAATDPCNLVGSLLPGVKVPRVTGSRVLFLDGVPVGTLIAGRIDWLQALTAAEKSQAKNLLLRGPTHLPAASAPASETPPAH